MFWMLTLGGRMFVLTMLTFGGATRLRLLAPAPAAVAGDWAFDALQTPCFACTRFKFPTESPKRSSVKFEASVRKVIGGRPVGLPITGSL